MRDLSRTTDKVPGPGFQPPPPVPRAQRAVSEALMTPQEVRMRCVEAAARVSAGSNWTHQNARTIIDLASDLEKYILEGGDT